nr:NAD(P)H-dependent oxidoreductase [Pseudaestuariivita rosea]
MHAVVVVATPEPQSTNARLADAIELTLQTADWSVAKINLNSEAFDPVEDPRHFSRRKNADHFDPQSEQRAAYTGDYLPKDVQNSIDLLQKTDLLVLQFPLCGSVYLRS